MDDIIEPKTTVTPKQAPAVCTLMADSPITVQQEHVPLLELQRLLLTAVATITERTLQRGGDGARRHLGGAKIPPAGISKTAALVEAGISTSWLRRGGRSSRD
jgi:hypothetical protein